MIERLIIRALRKGIDDLLAEPGRIATFFRCTLDLTEEEAEKVVELFASRTPTVQFQYPRKDPVFPLYAVVLAGEEEISPRALDDFGGFTDMVDPTAVSLGLIGDDYIVRTSIFRGTYHVITYSEHPDLTLYLYELAKHILIRERDYFKENGALDTALSGRDMGPDAKYGPEWVFVRRLEFQMSRQFNVYDDRGVTIRDVRGISVITDGDQPSVTGVTPYNVEPDC